MLGRARLLPERLRVCACSDVGAGELCSYLRGYIDAPPIAARWLMFASLLAYCYVLRYALAVLLRQLFL